MNLIIKVLPTTPRSLEVWTGVSIIYDVCNGQPEHNTEKIYLRPIYILRDAASETKKRRGLCGHGARWPDCVFQREIVPYNVLYY